MGDPTKQDVNDYYVAHGGNVNAVKKLIDDAEPFDDPLGMLRNPITPHVFELIIHRNLFGFFAKACAELKLKGSTLRWNDLSHALCVGNKQVPHGDLVSALVRVLSRSGYKLATTTANEHLEAVARKRRFNPARRWLKRLRPYDKKPWIERFCTECLKLPADDWLSRGLWRFFLIGMVARIMRPGCKMDNTLALVGGQGAEKGRMLSALVGEQFYDETAHDITSNQFLLGMEAVLWHLAEDVVRRRVSAEWFKGFSTRQKDRVRKVWDRDYQWVARSFVMVISTNNPEYLFDPTGSRRFWTVPLSETINVSWLEIEENRSGLFAEALAAFLAGEKWWFPEDSKWAEALRERNSRHELPDPLEDKLREVMGKATVPLTTGQLTEACHGPHMGHLTPQRMTATLRKLGYEPRRIGRAGSGGTVWMSTDVAIAHTKVIAMSRRRRPKAHGHDLDGEGWARAQAAHDAAKT